MKNIWQKISNKKGEITCLAPMADVTDEAFRQTIAKYSRHGKAGGGPDIFWTEFVSADGLASEKGRAKLLPNLTFVKNEKPIIAQIFSAKPENIKKAVEIISRLGFDGIDINMGCPDRKVEKQGAGAALMKDPIIARKVIASATSIFSADRAGALPISVKTRIGFNKIEYKEWLSEILKEDIKALTLHLRTRKEMSKVSAHYKLAGEISKFVKSKRPDIVLIANGDIKSIKDGQEKIMGTEFDGFMIGRGVFGNPWIFDKKRKHTPTRKEKIEALIYHLKIFEEKMSGKKSFDIMKKHFKAYISDFDNAKELRNELMLQKSCSEAIKILKQHKNI